MIPPELRELTPSLYSSDSLTASEDLVDTRYPQFVFTLKYSYIVLLDEERFAQLVPADERFHRPVAAKEVLNLTVLIDLLRRADNRRGNHLQRVRIRHAVALKSFRLLAVKHGKDHSGGPQQFRHVRHHLFRQRRLQVVQQIPQKHRVKSSFWILQAFIQKARRTAARRHIQSLDGGRVLAQPGLFLVKKCFPSAKNIFRRNAESPLDEKTQCCWPRWPQIQQLPSPQPVEIPQQLFQAVRNARGFVCFRRSRHSSAHGGCPRSPRARIRSHRPRNIAARCAPNSNAEFMQEAHRLIRCSAGTQGRRLGNLADRRGSRCFRLAWLRRLLARFHFALQERAFFNGQTLRQHFASDLPGTPQLN